MTSKTGRRSDSAIPDIDDRIAAALERRSLRIAQIRDGALPTTNELLTGLPICRENLVSDAMAYIDVWKEKRQGEVWTDLVVSAELARVEPSTQILATLYERTSLSGEKVYADQLLGERIDVWLAYLGDQGSCARVAYRALTSSRHIRRDVDVAFQCAFAHGLPARRGSDDYDYGDADIVLKAGFRSLERVIPLTPELAEFFGEGGGLRNLSRQRPSDEDDEDRAVGQLEALLESGVFEDDRDETLTGDGIVVVPKMGDGVGGQKEVRKSWKALAGAVLPVVRRGGVAAHKQALVGQYPHAADIIDIMLRDLAHREGTWFRPTLVVGAPGSGKSSLLRAIADQVGLPCELNSLAGSTDSSAMGTSAQWSTVRESVPLQLIKRSKHASVAVIWDEVDKVGTGRHNGSSIDALLPMLEPDQARRFRDLALEVEVDLSAVSHFATANDLESVPQPLRDRFRILTMPEPGWQHLGTLTRQIVDRIARERGIDPRFFGVLAEDELDLIRQAWPGGSIRQLTRIVATIIDGRDQILARC